MKKMTVSDLRRILEETDRNRLSNYLNTDATHEGYLFGKTGGYNYNCRVILEEEIKSPRVRILLLVFPKYCHERTIDDFFIAEYTARKEEEYMHYYNPKEYPFEYKYTYAKLKSIEPALSYKYKAYHEMTEEMAETDVELSEFRNDFRTYEIEKELCLIQYEKDNNKYDYFADVDFEHMRYRFGVIYKNIEKKTWKKSAVTSCLLFVPYDISEDKPLDEYNSYIAYLKSDREKVEDEYWYSNSVILDIEDAKCPSDEKMAEKVATMQKEMFE